MCLGVRLNRARLATWTNGCRQPPASGQWAMFVLPSHARRFPVGTVHSRHPAKSRNTKGHSGKGSY